jgi:hypothetical protein
MEELHRATVHQFGAGFGCGRIENEISVFRDALPVAVVRQEPSVAILTDIATPGGARVVDVELDARPQGIDPVSEQAADNGDAKLMEFVDDGRGTVGIWRTLTCAFKAVQSTCALGML